MRRSQIAAIVMVITVIITIAGCSHVGEDWKAAQAADTTEAYQDFLRQHPDSEYGVAAQERVRKLAEDRDWQQAAKVDTLDAYQQFVAVHADGKWAQEARVRIENFQLNTSGQSAPRAPGADGASVARTAAATTAVAAAATASAAPKSTTHGTSTTSAEKSSGHHYVQLGAYHSKSSAESAWQRISGRFPGQLKSLHPHYATATGSNTKSLVRLQVALPSTQRAHDLCAELKRQSQACMTIS